MANTIDTPMMIAELDTAFWNQLLARMEMQKVIPVVGPGAITFGPGHALLHPWLAQQVAAKRRDRFADSEVFYIPLRIDEGEPFVPANEPRGIKKIQAGRKSGGHLDDGFIEYLRQLQLEYIRRCGLTFTPPPPTP